MMRRLPLVIAATVAIAACAGATPALPEPSTRGASHQSPFADREDFEPTAFGVEVSGEGRPVIFIPGLASPGEVWAETVAQLEDDHECHVLTLSGFAGREPIDDPVVGVARRELVRYIRSRRLARPVMVGHSLGGYLALWLAATAPALVGPVVVVDAGPALSGGEDEARLLRAQWKNASDEEFALRAGALYSGMSSAPARMKPISALAAKSDRRTIGEAIHEMMVNDLTDRMPAVRAPVLFVLADSTFSQRYRRQAEGIRDKEFVVIPRTRHFVMIDAPKRFVAAVEAFLEANPP